MSLKQNFKTYLEDFIDNTNIIRERIEEKQYRLAQKYCPFYCMTFRKMHRNNGRTDLTDVMFSWRAEIKNAMDMFAPVEEIAKVWKDGVMNNNVEKAKTNFDKIMNEFGKAYMTTL